MPVNVFFAFADAGNYSSPLVSSPQRGGEGMDFRLMADDRRDTSATGPATLAALRRRIDEIDDALHDLLMRRAALVEEVAAVKRVDDQVPFRPGREAQIVRRLVGRHRGAFPRAALVRLWREILGATVAMQGELTVAVAPGCWDLARDHFGTLAPMALVDPDEAMLAVAEGRAVVGVLPLDDDSGEPWWLRLSALAPRPRVIARLPFGVLGNAAPDCQDAFVVAAMEPEASGSDCTLLIVAASDALDTALLVDALHDARLAANPVAAAAHGGGCAHLVEIETLLDDGDGAVGAALAPLGALAVTWLGAYARPLPDRAMGIIAPVS